MDIRGGNVPGAEVMLWQEAARGGFHSAFRQWPLRSQSIAGLRSFFKVGLL